MKNIYWVAGSLALLISACTKERDVDLSSDRSTLKIALINSLPVKFDGGIRRLPDNVRELCAVLISDTVDCSRTYIIDPLLMRLDLNKEFAIKTAIERGGAKDVNNPKVIGKLIQKNLNNVEVPKEFTAQQTLGTDVTQLITQFIKSKSSRDSILIFSEDGSLETYSLNNKTYKVFTDMSEIRNYMSNILCLNDKTNFTLLVNPPPPVSAPTSPLTLRVVGLDCQTGKLNVETTGGDGNTIIFSSPGLRNSQGIKEFSIPKKQRNGKLFTFIATQSGIESKITYKSTCVEAPGKIRGNQTGGKGRSYTNIGYGDLTIIKDSEGCEVCMHYYSATDNLGRRHEVKEKNSPFCCPCGKTIEIRGRTYRMECDGTGGNRLALVQ